jgi:CBS domain-containing protein
MNRIIGSRHRSGIYQESTNDERYGVLPGEDRLVHEVMSRKAVTIDATASIKGAAECMRNHDVSALVVCRNGEPVGALTEHDVVSTGAATDQPGSTTVHDVIKKRHVIRCRDDAILGDAIRAMVDHRLHALPVVNTEGHLTGLLLLVDAVGALTPHVAAIWLAKMRKSMS